MKRSIIDECIRRARMKHGPNHPSWSHKAAHYTFVVQNNKILEMGVNRPDMKPPEHYGYPAHSDLHSEIDAWRKARGILDKRQQWEILNIKLLRTDGYPTADAAPCNPCVLFLISQGCLRFYFTTSTGTGQVAKLLY